MRREGCSARRPRRRAAITRFDDLRQRCFDKGHCVVEDDHISFYVASRKNEQFEGLWVTIARPASRSGAGVFGLLRELVMHITTQGTWCAPAV